MIKIERKDYQNVTKLFEELNFNIVIPSVICGNTRGVIYVDCVDDPQTAVIWDFMREILISGNADNESVNSKLLKLINEFKLDAATRHIQIFDIYYSSSFKKIIPQILSNESVTTVERVAFKFERISVNWKNLLPVSCEMKRIDDDLLNDNGLKYIEHVKGWINSFWKSEDDFFFKGIGYCLIKENRILSWCLSVFVSGNNFELGLETVPYFRKNGYAKLTAAACLEYCLSKNITPFWQCYKDNTPSIKISESIGFQRAFEYDIFRITN